MAIPPYKLQKLKKPSRRSRRDDENAHCAIGAGDRPPEAPPGYVYYPAYGEPLPGSNCYWYRLPAYDAHGNMVGWRGRPVAFCSWLSGYRPWPLP